MRVAVQDKRARKFLKRMIFKTSAVKEKKQVFVAALSQIVFKDITRHFEREEGPRGKPWKELSPATLRQRTKGKRKRAPKILQDTGRLKRNVLPRNVRKVSDGLLWFNPTPYARKHDEGLGGMHPRPFMYLSKEAMKEIENFTVKFVMK
jgi:phage gpG-like protein